MAYQKQTFINNATVLTAEHLEHIEDGIYRNSVKSVKCVNGVPPDENGNVEIEAGGLSDTAANLLIGILRSVHIYDGDQSGKITALAAELGVTEEEPDTPVEPDEPVTPEKTLTSISATYSGGDVAVGTAVSELTGIVVTAHYSDGTSKAVTGYTLSGTIAEGSNTITVSYGGKTTTFTVTGVAESGGTTAPVSMVSMGSVTGKDYSWYTDSGETPYTGSFATRDGLVPGKSTKTFDNDTDVIITIASAEQKYDGFAVACYDGDKTLTNVMTFGTSSWQKPLNRTIDYTVKAGNYLFVTCFTGSVMEFETFSVVEVE